MSDNFSIMFLAVDFMYLGWDLFGVKIRVLMSFISSGKFSAIFFKLLLSHVLCFLFLGLILDVY